MRVARITAGLLAASALDVGSSLCLHGADQQRALPAKPEWLWHVQLALLLPLMWFAVGVAPACWRTVRSLCAPVAARLLVGLVAVLQLAHVFLRSEHYPFSAVTMFSDYVAREAEDAPRTRALFVVDTSRGPSPVSFLREGNLWFSNYLHLDYKTGWLLGTHAQRSPDSTARVARLLETSGGLHPRLVTVEVDAHDGALSVIAGRQASVEP